MRDMGSTYRERVKRINPPGMGVAPHLDNFNAGHRNALADAAAIAAEADARVAELEAAARRVAWFLRETDPHWVRVDTDDGPEIATLLGLAIMLEAALAATGAGAATGNAPRSEFNTLGEFLDAQQ